MNVLRQSTAVDIAIGPFVDATDGVTAETGLTIAQADVRLKKNNGAWAQVNDATSATHEENGWYEKELDATDTNTVGILLVAINESGALPVWHTFQVVEEAVYDRDYAAAATGIVGTAQTGDAFARLGAPAGASVSADVAAVKVDTAAILVDTGTTLDARIPAALVSGRMDCSVGAMAANVMTAAAAAADLTTELQSGLATAAALDAVDNFLDTEVAAILAAVDTEVAAIKAVTDLLPDAGALSSLATQASVNTIDDFLDTEIAAIKAKTDQLTFTVANQVDANTQSINDVTITGNGQVGTEFGV